MTRQITVEDILCLSPCSDYSREKIEGLFDGLPFVTVNQIAGCPIPAGDRVWVGVRLLHRRSYMVEFAEKCAERAKCYADAADGAADAAYYAAYYTADYAHAAYYAAEAAHADADDAAYYAAEAAEAADAAYYAAEAAHAAAYAAEDAATERDLQIKHLLELHARG